MTLSNLSDRGTLRGTLQRNNGNYDDLINKPTINGHTLIGNQSGHALGLANEDDIINVEANPLGSATADLHKILVDDTIYSIPDVVVYGTASGAIASFDDGGNDKPLKSLKVAINPVQDLHGYDAPWAGGAGKNKLDDSTVSSLSNVTYQNGVATEIEADSRDSVLFVLQAYNNGRYVRNLGTSYGTIKQLPFTKDSTFNQISFGNSGTTKDAKLRFDVSNLSDGEYIWCFTSENYTTHPFSWKDMMVVESSVTDYSYEPYSNICPISGWDEAEIHRADGATPHIIDDTYNITWSEAGEVFGGTLDVTNGKLKARPYYASYNGETLIGPWISSMDVYDPNTPPTTGAQVVDLGGVETEIDISPTQITTLLGNNNIWSDTGEIEECVYQRDLNIAINKALS